VAFRCLIVDDNRPFLDAARALLEEEGLTVAGIASTSVEALQQAETLQPDVVLLDIGLGEESGFDVAELLTADSGRYRARVILISTHAEADFADLIDESPAAGFLPKSELSAGAIHRLLDGGSNHDSR
jgi:DNA-binding NarL/FixJ family response regulator